jgi:hypothetical protein
VKAGSAVVTVVLTFFLVCFTKGYLKAATKQARVAQMSLSIALRPYLIDDTGNRLRVLQALRDTQVTVKGMVDELRLDRRFGGGIPRPEWKEIQPILQGTYPGLTNSIMRVELSLELAHVRVSLASDAADVKMGSATWREAVDSLTAAATALDELCGLVRTDNSEHDRDMAELGRSIVKED